MRKFTLVMVASISGLALASCSGDPVASDNTTEFTPLAPTVAGESEAFTPTIVMPNKVTSPNATGITTSPTTTTGNGGTATTSTKSNSATEVTQPSSKSVAPTTTATPTTQRPATTAKRTTTTVGRTTTTRRPTTTAQPTTTRPAQTTTTFNDWFENEINKPGRETWAVQALVNVHRGTVGCPEIRYNDSLNSAAGVHVLDMAENGFYGHGGTDGSSVYERAARQGYQFSALGENIARGVHTPRDVVNEWLASPTHRAQIENCSYQHSGVGVAYGSGQIYWVHVFGTPK